MTHSHLFARCPWVHSDDSHPPKTLGDLKMDNKRDESDPAIVITPLVIRDDPADIDIAALFCQMTIATKHYPTVRDIDAGGPKKRLGDIMSPRDELEEFRAVKREREQERLALLARARAIVADQTPDSPSRKRKGTPVVDSPASIYPPRNPSAEELDMQFFPSAKKRLHNAHVRPIMSPEVATIQHPPMSPEVATIQHPANATGAWSTFHAKPIGAPHVFGAQPATAAETRSLFTSKPAVPAETSSLFAPKPAVPAETWSLFAPKPTVPAEAPSLFAAKTTVPAQAPSLFTSKPTVPAEAPSLFAAKTTVPAQAPSLFATKPADTTPTPFAFPPKSADTTPTPFAFPPKSADTTATPFGFPPKPADTTATPFGFPPKPADTTATPFGFPPKPADTTATQFGFPPKPADITATPFSGIHPAHMVTESFPPGFGSQLQSGESRRGGTDMDIEREFGTQVTANPFAPAAAVASPFAPAAAVAGPFAPAAAVAGPFAPAAAVAGPFAPAAAVAGPFAPAAAVAGPFAPAAAVAGPFGPAAAVAGPFGPAGAVDSGSSGFRPGTFSGTSLIATSTSLPKVPSPFAGGLGTRPTAPASSTPIVFGGGRIVPQSSIKNIAWGSGAPRPAGAISWGSGAASSTAAAPSTPRGAASSNAAAPSTPREQASLQSGRSTDRRKVDLTSQSERTCAMSWGSGAVSSTAAAPSTQREQGPRPWGRRTDNHKEDHTLSRSERTRAVSWNTAHGRGVGPSTTPSTTDEYPDDDVKDGYAYRRGALSSGAPLRDSIFMPPPSRRTSESDRCHQYAEDAYAELADEEKEQKTRTRVVLTPRVKAPPPSKAKPPPPMPRASQRDSKVANPLGMQKKRRCFKCTFPAVFERNYCQRCINNGEERKSEPDTIAYQPKIVNRPEWESDGSRPTKTNIVARRMILSELGEKMTPAMRLEERQFWGRA